MANKYVAAPLDLMVVGGCFLNYCSCGEINKRFAAFQFVFPINGYIAFLFREGFWEMLGVICGALCVSLCGKDNAK